MQRVLLFLVELFFLRAVSVPPCLRVRFKFLPHTAEHRRENHMRVAFLGLGIMGRPMAAKLVKAGHEVTVWNRTPGKTVEGARLAASPAEAAGTADVVWICVSDTAAVDSVLFGENGAESALREGMTVVDSSTISPARTLAIVARLAEKGVEHIDAPVTGSKIGAESAQLIFIAGGE